MQEKPKVGHIVGATFLISGTCIGAGMLALPVATSSAGFLPSMLMMALCWVCMTITALFMLEAALWMEKGSHIITMSSSILGPLGKGVAWVTFLFVNYASLVAYIAGAGVQISYAFLNFGAFIVSKWVACSIFSALFGIVLYAGKNALGRVNTVLFVSLIVAYFCLVSIGIDEIRPSLIMHRQWGVMRSMMMIPLLLTTFSFPGIVPSIVPYLNRNVRWLRFSILAGTTITFFVYLVWQALVLGVVPLEGSHGLAAAFAAGEPAIDGLRYAVNNVWVSYVADYFAFFAIVTSFLGIALSLFDFLADGLSLNPKILKHHIVLALIIIVPSLVCALAYPRAFMVALETTGGFGDAILSCAMPALMVWVGRYYQKRIGEYRVGGGKVLLIMIVLFSTLVFALEFIEQVWGLTDFTDFR